MITKSKRTILIASGAVAALAAAIPGAAMAQYRTNQYGSAYDQQGQYYYDGCARSESNRAVVGGVLGAVAGAAIGNNTGSRRRNDENALIGGVLGAVAGASIGQSTAGCEPQRRPNTRAYNNYGYQSYGYAPAPTYGYAPAPSYGYAPAPSYGYAPPPAYGYGQGYGGYGYDQDDYAYGYGQNYNGYAQGANQCRYVEDSVRLPDGRTQTRMVQACRDSSGRYQIVQ